MQHQSPLIPCHLCLHFCSTLKTKPWKFDYQYLNLLHTLLNAKLWKRLQKYIWLRHLKQTGQWHISSLVSLHFVLKTIRLNYGNKLQWTLFQTLWNGCKTLKAVVTVLTILASRIKQTVAYFFLFSCATFRPKYFPEILHQDDWLINGVNAAIMLEFRNPGPCVGRVSQCSGNITKPASKVRNPQCCNTLVNSCNPGLTYFRNHRFFFWCGT